MVGTAAGDWPPGAGLGHGVVAVSRGPTTRSKVSSGHLDPFKFVLGLEPHDLPRIEADEVDGSTGQLGVDHVADLAEVEVQTCPVVDDPDVGAQPLDELHIP